MLYDCLDSFIHAIQLVAKTVAFLLGIHLVVLLHFIHFLTTDPIGTLRKQTQSLTSQRRGTTTTTTTTAARRGRGSQISYLVNSPPARRLRALHPVPYLLRLPSLEPRPHEDGADDPVDGIASGLFDYLAARIGLLGYRMMDEIVDLADQIESRGGKPGDMITRLRRTGAVQLKAALMQRLPLEITNYILMLAATEVPTKICLLSKSHHRLVIPRLYSAVDLSEPRIFRQLRLTLAVYKSSLGKHINSLSAASTTFDSSGYLPEGISETAALGCGLEQILLTAPNLKHLYLDVFALAALHDGTGFLMQTGALPISLSTEYAAPQYLSLPMFNHLRHVELTLFGLDKAAAEKLRQALPLVKSITLRWVTRQSRNSLNESDDVVGTEETVRPATSNSAGVTSGGNSDEEEDDDVELELSERERQAWRRGGYRFNDFALFVEAIDTLRTMVQAENTGSEEGSHQPPIEPLEAITVLAWPKAFRELSRYYRSSLNTTLSQVSGWQQDDPTWDKSMGKQDGRTISTTLKPSFTRPSRRVAGVTTTQTIGESKVQTEPTPLRLAVDPTYRLGPRRGPLECWAGSKGKA